MKPILCFKLLIRDVKGALQNILTAQVIVFITVLFISHSIYAFGQIKIIRIIKKNRREMLNWYNTELDL